MFAGKAPYYQRLADFEIRVGFVNGTENFSENQLCAFKVFLLLLAFNVCPKSKDTTTNYQKIRLVNYRIGFLVSLNVVNFVNRFRSIPVMCFCIALIVSNSFLGFCFQINNATI